MVCSSFLRKRQFFFMMYRTCRKIDKQEVYRSVYRMPLWYFCTENHLRVERQTYLISIDCPSKDVVVCSNRFFRFECSKPF
jgi:hypothetical protein